jgi:DNA-directed RNA polymerase specialized sigma24 family protein
LTVNTSAHEADQYVYQRLVDAGFRGRVFDRFADQCVHYAEPILRGWIVSGKIFRRKFHDVGLPQPSTVHPYQDADIDDLVQDTLAAAFGYFVRRGRAGEGWSAHGGASLMTYYIGACLLAFPNAHRDWERQERRFQRAKAVAAEVPDPGVYDPADLAVRQVETRDALAALGDSDRVVLLLGIAGYSRGEIGAILGITRRAAEGQLYRLRQRLRDAESQDENAVSLDPLVSATASAQLGSFVRRRSTTTGRPLPEPRPPLCSVWVPERDSQAETASVGSYR